VQAYLWTSGIVDFSHTAIGGFISHKDGTTTCCYKQSFPLGEKNTPEHWGKYILQNKINVFINRKRKYQAKLVCVSGAI
jgi:hypothetical protein